jgi:hypothetical protein
VRPLFKPFNLAALVVAFATAASLALAPQHEARAATPNIAVGAGQVMVLPFHISGAVSADAVGAVRFQMPQACNLIGVGVNSRALVGATNTIDVMEDGVTVLGSVITVAAAGTWYEGTIVDAQIADEAVVTINIDIVGTSLTDTTVVLTCARK